MTDNNFSNKSEALPGIAFLAFPEQAQLLLSELKNRFSFEQSPSQTYGDLFYFENKADFLAASKGKLPYWARTVMEEPFILSFDSIGSAANQLKAIQRSWAPYQFTCFRRAQLIQDKLPYVNLKERNFPVNIPQSPIGLYTLLDEHTLIASAKTSSFLPAGALPFKEDHENPPSRAYLKIQESLTMAKLLLAADLPSSNSYCFEAGACPGGWTWVLVGLGARVYAVDRAELAPSLMENPLVKFQAHDAFTLTPEEIGPVDWVFSDVICYPERLLKWIQVWLDSGLTKNMICTIKMQGEIDWSLISQFEELAGSRIVHLNYNKHELTWLWKADSAS